MHNPPLNPPINSLLLLPTITTTTTSSSSSTTTKPRPRQRPQHLHRLLLLRPMLGKLLLPLRRPRPQHLLLAHLPLVLAPLLLAPPRAHLLDAVPAAHQIALPDLRHRAALTRVAVVPVRRRRRGPLLEHPLAAARVGARRQLVEPLLLQGAVGLAQGAQARLLRGRVVGEEFCKGRESDC